MDAVDLRNATRKARVGSLGMAFDQEVLKLLVPFLRY